MGVLDDIAAETQGKGGGVLDRLAAEVGGSPPKPRSKAETERLRREFVAKEGTLGTRVKEGAKDLIPSRKQVADFARPSLEMTGMALGAIGGAALGAGTGGIASPLLGVAGAATGYASGKYVADAIEGAPQSAPQTIKDLGTGAMYEMGGQVVGRGIAEAAKRAPAAINAVRHPIQTRAEGKAKQVLSTIADLTPQEAANAAKAQAVTSRLGVKLTPAQMTGKPTTAAMEQGLATADPAFAGALNAQDASAKQVALDKIRQGVGKGKPLPNAPDLATTGQNITAGIDSALKPVKAAEKELWEKVPNYPIPTSNFDEAANAIKATPMEADTESAVLKILDFANRMPKTTKGLQSIERTIGDKMQGADANVRRILGDLKKALGADFDAMGTAAETGDIALHEGKVIFPAKLQTEREALTARIERDMQAAESKPDLPSIVQSLKEAGDPPNQWMKQVAETQKQYQERLLNRYNAKIGKEVPSLSTEPPASVVDAQKRIEQIDAILQPVASKGRRIADRLKELDNLQDYKQSDLEEMISLEDQWDDFVKAIPETPAVRVETGYGEAILHRSTKKEGTWQLSRFNKEGDAIGDSEYNSFTSGIKDLSTENFNRNSFLDGLNTSPGMGPQPAKNVGASYKAAKDFSRTQKFDRFGKGAVSRVLQKGNEASGLRVTDENVGRQFFTPSGAAGLVKAVGSKAAKEQMKPYVIADITKAAAPDGATFNVQRGIAYIQKNRATLERLGLADDAKQLVKEQIPAELERMLAKRAPDAATGSQFFTAQDMRGILQKYGNTIKQMYGPETLQAFRDYNNLMGLIERKNVIPRGGNSNTAEKAMNLANLMIKESVGPNKTLTDGLLGAMAKGAGLGGGATFAAGHFSGKAAVAGAGLNAARQMLANADSQVAKAFVKILQDATTNPQTAKDLMKLRRTGEVPKTLQAVIDSHLIGATAAGVGD